MPTVTGSRPALRWLDIVGSTAGRLRVRASTPLFSGPLGLLLVAFALAGSVGGLLISAPMVLQQLGGRVAPDPGVASLDGLTLSLEAISWVGADIHAMHSGPYPMPAQMMPDAPDPGDDVLQVHVAISNNTRSLRMVGPAEFAVVTTGGTNYKANAFAVVPLRSGESTFLDLTFDVPEDIHLADEAPTLALVWDRGEEVRVPLSTGTPPEHHHQDN